MTVSGIHHVMIAVPDGTDGAVRRFYGGLLGFAEVAKPAVMAGRGGLWFQAGTQQLHVASTPGFHPAERPHVAMIVDDLEAMRVRLEAAAHATRNDTGFDGYERFHVRDPFGNRLEFMSLVLDDVAAWPGEG